MTGDPRTSRWLLPILLLAWLLPRPGQAHPLAPGLLELQELGNGRIDVRWKRPLPLPEGISLHPRLPAPCRDLQPPEVARAPDHLTLRWQADCGPGSLVGWSVGLTGLEAGRPGALLRVTLADGRRVRAVLSEAAPAVHIPARERPLEVASSFLRHGLHHLLTGPDHLLFVAGLVWLVAGRRRLFWTITAFTAGHSVTLGLAALDLVRFPSSIAEMLIAATILLLGLELARPEGAPPGVVGRRPGRMAAAFGLVHGLGFAGGLIELGLPPAEVPLALLSFNLGIEAGQMLFVAGLLGLRRVLAAVRVRWPGWTAQIPAYGVGSLAAYWCLERAWALL